MDDDLWRLTVKLKSRRILNEYAKHMDLSVRDLARKAGIGHAIVGHLMSGKRSTCNAGTAAAIERALGCPPGLLFERRMSTVSPSNGQKQKQAVA
jgi:DNA-binding Xre family transcriptional regulator